MYKFLVILLVFSMIILPIYSSNVNAYSDHPNLFVSAENSLFDNHFAGPMIVQVIVQEDNTQ
ncbi:MAG TPA: hypothetical protein VFJ23_03005, partial [Candidatus Nitrosotalea sp.]|nr:hypothetical protein [Candidatus Nitrosotalea sp.]